MNFKTKVLFPVLYVVAVLVTLEVGLRLFGIQPGSFVQHRFGAYDFDSTFGWVTKKNSSFLRISPEYMHYNYYDPEGLPTSRENWKVSPSKDTEKIAFLGNSFVESYYVPYEMGFPYLVNKELKNLEILNLGVSGYTPAQYILQARKYLPQYKINKLVFFYNPYQDVPHLNADYFPGGFAKPVFRENFNYPINTPLKKAQRSNKSIEDYSSIITFLQPVLFRWFGFTNDFYHLVPSPSQLKFDYPSQLKTLTYARQIQQESKVGGNFYVIYLAYKYELTDKKVFAENIDNFQKACADLQLNCMVPDHFLDEKEDYKKLFYSKDAHPSSYGAAKTADYLIKLLN